MGVSLHQFSLSEYLAWEAAQAERHEFHRGETLAMVGSRRGHARIVANMVRHLGNHLDGTPCQVFSQGMKVQIGDDTVVYPDVFVTCDERFEANALVVTAPVVVMEVLSPSTQGYDRSLKFDFYRRLPSLREYALIDPDTRRVEVFRPDHAGRWTLFDMSDAESLTLDSIGAGIALAAPFDGMRSGRATVDD